MYPPGKCHAGQTKRDDMKIELNGRWQPRALGRPRSALGSLPALRAFARCTGATLIVGAVVTATLIVACMPRTAAAPAASHSAQDTVESLQASGYRVIVNRVGSLPLDECTVTSMRPGRPVTQAKSLSDDLEDELVYTTVYVDAKC
jgi:hypothetical protein